MSTVSLKSDRHWSNYQFEKYFENVFCRVPRAEHARVAAKAFGYSIAAMTRYLTGKADPPIVLTMLLWHESTYAEQEIDYYRHWLLMNNEALRNSQREQIARLTRRISELESEVDELKQHAIKGGTSRLIAANTSVYRVG